MNEPESGHSSVDETNKRQWFAAACREHLVWIARKAIGPDQHDKMNDAEVMDDKVREGSYASLKRSVAARLANTIFEQQWLSGRRDEPLAIKHRERKGIDVVNSPLLSAALEAANRDQAHLELLLKTAEEYSLDWVNGPPALPPEQQSPEQPGPSA